MAKVKERYLPIELVAEQLEALREQLAPKYAARRLAKENTKLNSRAQDPTRIEATINTALILLLLTIIGYTVACSI